MSGGRVTVSGTNYTIKNGRVTVGGTNYSIKKGKTTIGGTNYTIFLKEMTTNALFKNMSIKAIDGNDTKNSSEPDVVHCIPPSTGTYYAFGFSGGGIAIARCVCTSSAYTVTQLKKVTSSEISMNITIAASGTNYIYNDSDALSDDGIRGTLILAQFPGYTVAEVDSILSASTPAVVTGRYKDSGANIYTTASSLVGKVSIIAYSNNMAFNYFSSATSYTTLVSAVTSGYTSGLVYINSSNAYISTNGTSAASCRTGTIATI